jgi:osmotically-inducible protein OsmY
MADYWPERDYDRSYRARYGYPDYNYTYDRGYGTGYCYYDYDRGYGYRGRDEDDYRMRDEYERGGTTERDYDYRGGAGWQRDDEYERPPYGLGERYRTIAWDRDYGRCGRGYTGYAYYRSWGATGPYTGRGPQGYKRSDDRIMDGVAERLARYEELDPTGIQVIVNNGEVTLTGKVESRYEKRLAEDLAESVWGVTNAQNNLKVEERSTLREAVDKIRDALTP